MAIFVYTFIGLIVGVIAFVAMPATQRVGLFGAVLLGMLGGTVGGLIGTTIVPTAMLTTLNPIGTLLATGGALLVSVGMMLVNHRRGIA